MEEVKNKKKKKDLGRDAILCAVIALGWTIYEIILIGAEEYFIFSLLMSILAVIVGVVSLCIKDGGNKTLAIIGLIISVPLFFICLIGTWVFWGEVLEMFHLLTR